MRLHPSPNYDRRDGVESPAYIILHYTGMETARAALERLCDPASKVSAHYLIDEDGHILQLVADAHRAWHAGDSFWKGQTDLNSLSLGIELVNPGHAFGYRHFPEVQIESLNLLLRDLYAKYTFSADSLLGHSDIAPRRKEDPGELFPWQRLAQEGFGLWPVESMTPPLRLDSSETVRLLAHIGYEVTDPSAALRAFQRHFCPEELGREAGPLTCGRLKALGDL